MQTFLPIEKILKSTELKNHLENVHEYIRFIEAAKAELQEADYSRLLDLIINLYKSARQMPFVDLKSNVEFDEKVKNFEQITANIEQSLGDNRYYWNVFNPKDSSPVEPVCFDLADDLTDIYKDLKYAVIIYDLGTPDAIENAVWQLKCDFDMHYGNHAINAMRAIHFILKPEVS